MDKIQIVIILYPSLAMGLRFCYIIIYVILKFLKDFVDYDTTSNWTANKSGLIFPLKIHTCDMWEQVIKLDISDIGCIGLQNDWSDRSCHN